MNEIEERALAEIVQQAGDPEAAMQELYTHFEILSKTNPDENQVQVLSNAWGLVEQVYNAAGASFALLVAARQFSQETQEQNGTLIDHLEQLKAGLEDPFGSSHPLVEAALEMIREAEGETALAEYEEKFEEWRTKEFDFVVEEAEEYAWEMVHDSMTEDMAWCIHRTSAELYDLLELLKGDRGQLTEGESQELWDWYLKVSDRIRDENAKRLAERMKYSA